MTTALGTPLAQRELLRVAEIMQARGSVFVFGSNVQGVHGKGAAKHAARYYGALHGKGSGLAGRSYAIPTKYQWREGGMPRSHIAAYVTEFLYFARAHPELVFAVTRIGCGNAGYTDDDMAPLFAGAPDHCHLPEGWAALAQGV